MAGRPTMADVAEQAGVSKMTVSRVINGRAGISDDTRLRVLESIASLGFVPSQRGRSLAVGRSNLLGMIVLNVTSEWVWSLVLGAGQAAEALGYQLLLRTTGPGAVASFDTGQPVFGSDLVDGVIIVSWRVPLSFARGLARRHFPVVLIDAYARPDRVGWVSTEDRIGAREATLYLATLGHRAIGFIGGGEAAYLAQQRLAGFKEGAAAAGLGPRHTLVVHGDFGRDSGCHAAQELLQRRRRPTAILAASDPMAVGALDAALELGLAVPGDLSIVGFDDMPIATHVNPRLTTVARPYQDMGAAAVRLVVDALEAGHAVGSRPRMKQMDLPTRLVVRESTGRVTGDG
jgi:LacI family transcriptional regulator